MPEMNAMTRLVDRIQDLVMNDEVVGDCADEVAREMTKTVGLDLVEDQYAGERYWPAMTAIMATALSRVAGIQLYASDHADPEDDPDVIDGGR